MKITCIAKESKKSTVISDLEPRSTINALKFSIIEDTKAGDDVEVQLFIEDKPLTLRPEFSLKQAKIQDGSTVSYTVAKGKKPKIEILESKTEVPTTKTMHVETKIKPSEDASEFKIDMGHDWRTDDGSIDIEAEEKNWGAWEFEGQEVDEEPESAASAAEDEPTSATSPPAFRRQRSYVVMAKGEISQMQKDMGDELVEKLAIDASRAMMLLRAYDWDIEKAVTAYKEDSKKALQKAGVKAEVAEEEMKKKPKLERQDSAAEFTCGVCDCECAFRESYALACGHRYCNTCWGMWINASFDKGQESVFTECPFGDGKTKCHETVPPMYIMKNLDAKKRAKFEEWQAAAFVKQTQYIKWCPRAGCDRAVEYRGKQGMKKVTCMCGYSFCFGCGSEDHEPCPCDNAREWLMKASKESDIFKWLEEQKDNTEVKNCTKCKIVIEKNQGCKHMTCRNCRHEFCWLCFQDWHGHDNTYCTQYVQDHAGEREAKERSGEEEGDDFRRYQFYYGRWDHYRNSVKFAERIKENAEKRMDALQNMKGSGSTAVQFLLDAVETVIACRKLLEWSYAWSYFLKEKGPLRELFRNHLNNLEEFTEELGELTEQPLDKLMLDSQRTEVVNKTRVIQKYRKNIIDFARDQQESSAAEKAPIKKPGTITSP